MTKEEKAAADKAAKRAFFALYIDQLVMFDPVAPPFNACRDKANPNASIITESYLELTDLRNITDEHAQEVARVASGYDNSTPELGRQLLERYVKSRHCNLTSFEWLSVFDYLRSKGYATPFPLLLSRRPCKNGVGKD